MSSPRTILYDENIENKKQEALHLAGRKPNTHRSPGMLCQNMSRFERRRGIFVISGRMQNFCTKKNLNSHDLI